MPSFLQVCAELDRRRHITLGLERIEALLATLGRPDSKLPHIAQIVGTNGKGTTALALAAALEELGCSSGTYLSPHVLSYTERVVLRGRQVSEVDFALNMWKVIAAADERGIPASQFELLTAGALRIFADAGLEWVVLEAGLGARHDATSAVEAEAVVLTNVALDHTQYLGETVMEIAAEKIASLRPGATLLLGTEDPRVLEVADGECRRIGARMVRVGDVDEERRITRFGLVPYAARDVGLGFAAAEVLLDHELTSEAREAAAASVRDALPGRFEVHEVGGVPVVADGGHNAEGIAAALAAVRVAYGERPLAVVFGVLHDKDAGSMLTALRGEAQAIVLTRPEGERAANPALVARDYEPLDLVGRRAVVVDDAVEAMNLAVGRIAEAGGVVLVTGSLSTAAPVLRWLREE